MECCGVWGNYVGENRTTVAAVLNTRDVQWVSCNELQQYSESTTGALFDGQSICSCGDVRVVTLMNIDG